MFAPSCGGKIAHPCERRTRDVGLHLRRQPFLGHAVRWHDRPHHQCLRPRLFVLAQRQEDPDTLFFNRRLSMEGDTELGLVVKNTLDGLELPVFDLQQWTPPQVLARIKVAKHRAGTGSHAEGRP